MTEHTERDTPALELKHASAAYGPYRALYDVSLSVSQRGIVALVGSNGAGKSTVARVVSGLVPLSKGQLLLQGKDFTDEPPWKISRAGLTHVPEEGSVFASLSVQENLVLAFRRQSGRSRSETLMEGLYNEFPALGARKKQVAGTLSGGERRLLSLAKVLAAPPRVLVADELSLGLSPAWTDAVYRGLLSIHRGGTALVIVEQHLDRVLEVAGWAVVLDNGSVAWSGPPKEAPAVIDELRGPRYVPGPSRPGKQKFHPLPT